MVDVENDNQLHDGRVALAELPVGKRARVLEVTEAGALGERLLEMGLTAGTCVQIVRRGLFGDPLQLLLRGYMLSVRRDQARRIAVELLP
jgi:Fe2+ transport system protein FeoA